MRAEALWGGSRAGVLRRHGGMRVGCKELRPQAFIIGPIDARRFPQARGQSRPEFMARQLAAAERCEVLGALLAVDHRDRIFPAKTHECGERNLRCIGAVRKHRLAEEHAPEAHAVEPACELAVEPGLEAVHGALAVPFAIGVDHFGDDPGAVLPFARRRSACGDDTLECAVDAYLAAGAAA